MAENELQAYSYQILRYTPNLVRDEWVNIGVLLYSGNGGRPRLRVIGENAEFARVRRLHPAADERLLRALGADLEGQLAEAGENVGGFLRKLDETLSNVLQLSPKKGVLADDLDAELERLYVAQVEPPRRMREAAGVPSSRGELRVRINSAVARLKMGEKIAKGMAVEEYTYAGDRFRLDYGYRRNGTRGYLHALVLGRDAAAAKVLAYTVDSMRAKMESAEFHAVTEVEPQAGNPQHAFMAGLLGKSGITTVPAARVGDFLERLKPHLR